MQMNESQKTAEPDFYEQFISKQNCDIKHGVSAGAREVSGLIECYGIWKKTSYIGDGDINSYSEIVKKDPYPGTVVQKLGCIGHVQKRVGHLHKLKSNSIVRW